MRPWKLIIGLVILLPVLAHLAYAFWHSPFTNYYLTVDEFWASERDSARIAGLIVPGSISRGQEGINFRIRGEGQVLEVAYQGVLPDTFRPGLTAIVEGRLEDGVFLADTVMVKCPHEFLAVS